MSEELETQVAELARRLEDMGVRVDGIDVRLRTDHVKFSEKMALIITTIVGVIMTIFVVLSGINLFYG